ncbi:hypothetical protein R3W88_033286 [Solanum pinnatisectum]|uniref:F-box associated domain-containing protein n=1 Tax=Solanum pinnatisectum TaxID=50273 RepID=A0AAV9K1P8_9SOLN|nr:hypothetical protein R3W88_033286 [Solanum pinnatisectum]
MEAYDILFPIIIKLSVKSLLCFQSVSKLQNAIISDKEFRKIHIDQSKASSTTKFLLVQTNDGVFEFRDLENPQIIMRKQKFPLKRCQNPIVMGSCDSLVLMKTCMDDNEYCIMGISVIGGVFWSFSSLEILHQFVNTYSTIIYFDVKTDELKDFAKPYFVSAYQLFYLTSLKGCVGLYGGFTGLYGDITFGLDVWIMEQGGWTLLMKINNNNLYFCDRSISNIVLLDCTRNSEILFQIGRSLERLVMYDPKRHEFIQTFCISEDSKHDSISEDSKHDSISEDSKHDIIPICSESFYFPIET